MQVKLDELIRAVEAARNDYIGIEHLTDLEICTIREALEADEGIEPKLRLRYSDNLGRFLQRR